MARFKWSVIALVAALSVGFLIRGKIESLGFLKWGTKDAVAGDEVAGSKHNPIGGDNTAGTKVGTSQSGNANGDSTGAIKASDTKGDVTGRDKVEGDNLNGGSSKVSINAQPGSTINISPGDPKYDNKKQPNVVSEAQSVDLARFKSALPFTKDMLLDNYKDYTYPESEEILVNKRPFNAQFRLVGNTGYRTTAFKLNGTQKAVFLQFGLSDLTERKSDTLTYDVNVTVSNSSSTRKVWAGKVIYGSKEQQIISLPFEAADMKMLVIEYGITQGDDKRPLYITRAESLSEN
jgi:hypothetical protein